MEVDVKCSLDDIDVMREALRRKRRWPRLHSDGVRRRARARGRRTRIQTAMQAKMKRFTRTINLWLDPCSSFSPPVAGPVPLVAALVAMVAAAEATELAIG